MNIDFSDEYFMKLALKEAEKAFEKNEIPIGAVIVGNKQVLAKAHNFSELLNDPTAHAEMQAITSATEIIGGKYLNDCTIYVTMEPCVMCAGALFWAQIGRIVFGAYDDKRGYSVFSTSIVHPKTKILGGILEEESKDLINRFFLRLRSQ
jgi:tRNA(adenine34) deaminase